MSGIIREPLNGVRAQCPVDLSTEVNIASPSITITNIIKFVEMDRKSFGASRLAVNFPGITLTVADMIESLRRISGADAVKLIDFEVDVEVAKIVCGWPSRFESKRAEELGLTKDASFDAIVEMYIKDHL